MSQTDLHEHQVADLYPKIKDLPSILSDQPESVRRVFFQLAIEKANNDAVIFWLFELLLALTKDTPVAPETVPPAVKRLLLDHKASTSFKQVRDVVGILNQKVGRALDSMISVEVTMPKEDREVIHAWLKTLKSTTDALRELVDTDR